MNVINKILGKDISSIVFKYLIKKDIKLNYLKVIGYINKRLYPHSYINDNNYTPKSIKLDQSVFHTYYLFNSKLNRWYYCKTDLFNI
jgi:hypothetical protein